MIIYYLKDGIRHPKKICSYIFIWLIKRNKNVLLLRKRAITA